VPHVELSVSEPHLARSRPMAERSLRRWAGAVAGAAEPSLVIDDAEVVVAISPSLEDLLGLIEPAVGRELRDVLQPVDFADGGELTDDEIVKLPPLLALASGQLARGLLRVQSASGPYTLDAIATPILDGGRVMGSLTFFSPV
jgi:hypothetical protein